MHDSEKPIMVRSHPHGDSPNTYDMYPPSLKHVPALQVYLPGIDGTGLAAWQQFPAIVERFALVCMSVPVDDRTPFEGLVTIVADYMDTTAATVSGSRPIYLLGESFGGLLALAVAERCSQSIDRVVLVNPATSYRDSMWPPVRHHTTAKQTMVRQVFWWGACFHRRSSVC